MYPDEGGDDQGQVSRGDPKEDQQREEEDAGGTLVPKAFFGGDVDPGHKCQVEVVHVYDDDVEIKYVKPGEEGKGEKESEMAQTDSKIDKMASMSEGE